eukprot:NODE_3654_length_759_cov_175.791193.p2 GENE.NODE_3654_length_759_cov_175.791193~~NODE_3654_length_759_cov_175.791193.p2  ORF type:complete len:208 (+),score=45.63 NODE_3654_length_759_cov_175.791193:3-626(+)
MGLTREPADGLLRWFEEYVRRLEEGIYGILTLRPELPFPTAALSLFPIGGPEHHRSVHRGVEVTCSCVYMPEHSHGWTYSITLMLVAPKEERGFETCQLHSRAWEITADGCPMQLVRGEGLIGFYPILSDGGWELNTESDPHEQYRHEAGHMEGPFRYQSCSGRMTDMCGTFGGELTFLPGTIGRPTGPPFQVRMKPMRLYVPEFIY